MILLLYTKLKKLSNSIKYHHIVSTLFGIISIFTDFFINNVAKLLFLYCISACFTYNVNLFMGMRFLLPKKDLITLQKKCLYSYTISCALNWGISHILSFLQITIQHR